MLGQRQLRVAVQVQAERAQRLIEAGDRYVDGAVHLRPGSGRRCPRRVCGHVPAPLAAGWRRGCGGRARTVTSAAVARRTRSDVAADDRGDVRLSPAVLQQPGGDVAGGLAGVLQPGHVADLLVRRHRPGHRVPGRLVQADMIAEERVRTQRHVRDAKPLGQVGQVVHDRLQIVPRVRRGQGRVRRGRHGDHAAGGRYRVQHGVGLHPRRRPHGACTGVADDHGRPADPACVQRGAVADVGHVDGDAERR